MYDAFRYFMLTLRHKWFVFKYGLKLKVPVVSLIVHDYTKLYPSNMIAYGNQFFGDQSHPDRFAHTWNHHQKRHRHHWEYWVMITGHNRGGYPDGTVLDIPEKYLREMAADWLAASRTYENKLPNSLLEWDWYQNNMIKSDHIQMTNKSRTRIIQILEDFFNNLT